MSEDEDEEERQGLMGTGTADSVYSKSPGAKNDDFGPPATLRSEFSKLTNLAVPLSLTFGLQQASQQVNIMFVGQLGAKELGAVVLATMWANVSGTSICMGGMTALDSLASQAFGAGEFELVGILLQRCIWIVTLLTIPIFGVWWFATGYVLGNQAFPVDTPSNLAVYPWQLQWQSRGK